MIIKTIEAESPQKIVPRKPSEQVLEFEEKLETADKLVYTNDAGFLSFEHEAGSIASSGFSNGVGVVIATAKGALIGNFNQTDEGFKAADTFFRELYTIYDESLSNGQLIIYGQVKIDETTWKAPKEVQRFINLMEDMTGQTAETTSYLNPPDNWVDHEGTPLDDEAYSALKSGGFLVENDGGNGATVAIFVTAHMQKEGTDDGEQIDE